jgi:hypothetical protein
LEPREEWIDRGGQSPECCSHGQVSEQIEKAPKGISVEASSWNSGAYLLERPVKRECRRPNSEGVMYQGIGAYGAGAPDVDWAVSVSICGFYARLELRKCEGLRVMTWRMYPVFMTRLVELAIRRGMRKRIGEGF